MNNTPITLIRIARELSVTPGALSNWQKRYEDFPKPSSVDGRRRYYLLSDVQAFMDRHDLKSGSQTTFGAAGRTVEAKLIAPLLDDLRDLPISNTQVVLALLGFTGSIFFDTEFHQDRLPDSQTSTPSEDLASDIGDGYAIFSQLPSDVQELHLTSWKKNADELSPEKVATRIRNILQDLSGRKVGGEHTTSESVARLVWEIVKNIDVLDLCSGYGTLLRQARRSCHKIVGQEIDTEVASISRLLAFLEGYHLEIFNEDSLSSCHQEWLQHGFFGVVAEPPMGLRLSDDQINPNDLRWRFYSQARRNQADDFWIQSALAYLRPSSETSGKTLRAVLLLRSGWFFDGAEGPMRDALLRSGCVEAVIALGGGTSSGTGIPMNLLVLRKTDGVSSTVRMIDAQQAGRVVRGIREFSRDEVTAIVDALNGSATSGDTGVIRVFDVPVTEIIENGSVLHVQRYVIDRSTQLSRDEILEDFRSTMKDLQKVLAALNQSLDDFDPQVLTSLQSPKAQIVSHVTVAVDHVDAPEIQSLFKNRPQDRQWTRDEIRSDDVVICLHGVDAGQALAGEEFLTLEKQWVKVWILRSASHAIDQRYLLTWAKYGGLELQIRSLISGTTLPTLAKRDLTRIYVPVPTTEIQVAIANWGDTVNKIADYLRTIDLIRTEFLGAVTDLTKHFFIDLEGKKEQK